MRYKVHDFTCIQDEEGYVSMGSRFTRSCIYGCHEGDRYAYIANQ